MVSVIQLTKPFSSIIGHCSHWGFGRNRDQTAALMPRHRKRTVGSVDDEDDDGGDDDNNSDCHGDDGHDDDDDGGSSLS